MKIKMGLNDNNQDIEVSEEDIQRTREINMKEIDDEEELKKRVIKKGGKKLRKLVFNGERRAIKGNRKESKKQVHVYVPRYKPGEKIQRFDGAYNVYQNTDGVIEFKLEPLKEHFYYYEPITLKFNLKNISDRNVTVNKRLGTEELFSHGLQNIIKYAPRPSTILNLSLILSGFSPNKPRVRTSTLLLEDFIELEPDKSYEIEYPIREFMDCFLSLNISPGKYHVGFLYSVFKGLNDGHEFNLNAWTGALETSCVIDLTTEGIGEENYHPRYGFSIPNYRKKLLALLSLPLKKLFRAKSKR